RRCWRCANGGRAWRAASRRCDPSDSRRGRRVDVESCTECRTIPRDPRCLRAWRHDCSSLSREEENMMIEDGTGPPAWRVSALAQITELLPHGVILCDRRGKVLFANRIAEALLSARDGLLLDGKGEIRGRVPEETMLLRRALEDGGAVRASRETGQTLPL